jgi:hypothetical protein
MKLILSAAALACGLMTAVTAHAADYAVIRLESTVDAPIEHTWSKVGGYCQIDAWFKRAAPCIMTSGEGGVGSVRKLGPTGAVVEIEVAATRYSYTYTQAATTILYHGTLAAEPLDGGKKTRLLYTIFYDQEPDGTPEAKDKDRANRTATFTGALADMKILAEAK